LAEGIEVLTSELLRGVPAWCETKGPTP